MTCTGSYVSLAADVTVGNNSEHGDGNRHTRCGPTRQRYSADQRDLPLVGKRADRLRYVAGRS